MSSRSEIQTLKKRMLIARAAMERIELGDQVHDLRRATTLPALLKVAWPKFAVSKGLPFLFTLFKRYPIIGSGLSLAATRLRSPALKSAVKWSGLAILAWQGWRWLRRGTAGGEERSGRGEPGGGPLP